jgi:glycosyltransferase involved in cell wall biosynthesis
MPKVTVIVPCFNEHRTIGLLLESILNQTFPLDDIEVVIADGMSTDGTRAILDEFSRDHSDLNLRVVDNPDRIIPAALNRAIDAAQGEVIIRLDAHSIPNPDYIERCMHVLENTGAANVGGVWMIRPSHGSWMARAIAVAAAHPLGAGDARYRTSGVAGAVDTVPFGAFRREWIEKAGPFNEALQTNEDYEFNVRLRRLGGLVWFDPSISSTYFARGDLLSLARQYARYGYWKARMLMSYPQSLRWRQILPPLFVLVIIVLGLIGLFSSAAWVLLGLQLGFYAGITFLMGLIEAIRRRDLALIPGFPLAIWTMHLTWGGSFLWSLVTAAIGGEREASRA